MKRFASCIAVLMLYAIMAGLGGCGDSPINEQGPTVPESGNGEGFENTSSENGYDSEDKYERKISDLVKLEIPASRLEGNYSGYAVYRAQRKYFDFDEARNFLMKDADIIYEAFFDDGLTYNCDSAAGSFAVVNPGNVDYCTEDYLNKVSPLRILLNKAADEYDPQALIRSDDLPFMTQEAARDLACEYLCEMSGEKFVADKLYTFGEDVMREHLDGVTVNDGDSAYYITLRQELDGLYLSSQPHGSPTENTLVIQTEGAFAVSEKGISLVNIHGAFTVLEEVAGSRGNTLMSAEEAVDAIVGRYEQIIAGDSMTITDMELIYVPVIANARNNEYLLTPAWCYSISSEFEYGGKMYERDSFVLIDAVSGEEIL